MDPNEELRQLRKVKSLLTDRLIASSNKIKTYRDQVYHLESQKGHTRSELQKLQSRSLEKHASNMLSDHKNTFTWKPAGFYGRCTNEELIRFVKDRKLPVDLDSILAVTDMVDNEGVSSCTLGELMHFIESQTEERPVKTSHTKSFSLAEIGSYIGEARKNRDAQRKTTEHHAALCKLLEEADRTVTIPFESLNPDIRNCVYEQLLALKAGKSPRLVGTTCQPNILATSKTVYAEASKILYGINSPKIELWKHKTLLGIFQGPSENSRVPYRGVSLDVNKWPAFLHKMHSVTISLDIDEIYKVLFGNAMERHARLSHWADLLLSLCCFLESSPALKRVIIDFRGCSDDGFVRIDEVALHPLSRLIARFKCAFVQSCKGWQAVHDKLREDAVMNADLYRINTLGLARVLQLQLLAINPLFVRLSQQNNAKAYRVRDLLKACHKGVVYDSPATERGLQDRLWDVSGLLDEVVKDKALIDVGPGYNLKLFEAEQQRQLFIQNSADV